MSCYSLAECINCAHSGVDCIFAAHDHQTALCQDLKQFCGDPDGWGDVGRAGRLHRFLGVNVVAHMADEDENLLPLLRRRGLLVDEDADAALIAAEHRRERLLLDKVARQLGRLAAGVPAADPTALVVGGAAFAHNYRKHVAAEDARLRPYAAELSEHDHDVLRGAMRRRRAV